LFSKYLGIFLPDTKNTVTGKEKKPIKCIFSFWCRNDHTLGISGHLITHHKG